jgi:DNA-binding GntR family transcriptional regulator
MLQELSSFFLQTRSKEKKIHPKEKNERTLREHTIILEEIRTKNTKAAKKAISENIDTMRSNLHLK